MLLLVGLAAALLPAALVWRLLLRRTGWWPFALAALLAAGAGVASWRATRSLADREIDGLRAAFRAGPPVDWAGLDAQGRAAAGDAAHTFMARARLADQIPGGSAALGAALAGVMLLRRRPRRAPA
ncbi:MAG: hypothetical protein H6706_27165 [Myxococcales bacterium]|nr:hypothetical protein [Myxococcales bacterium]